MVLEYSNLFFSSLFVVEMLLKIIAEGFFGYVKNGFNLFDSFIVILRFDYFSFCVCINCVYFIAVSSAVFSTVLMHVCHVIQQTNQ